MTSSRRLLASAVALCCCAQALAESSEDDLLQSFGEEEFLSIATGQKQLIAKAPAVASVITAEDIKTLGATTLEEVLATVPGVHVSVSSAYLSPIYSVRGVYTDKNPQVLMLVNGVPITNLHFGDRGGRSSFPVRDIARVEVIRGPGSAVYGADALSGVINIITKSAEQIDGIEFGARTASFGTRESWLLAGTHWGEVDVAFSVEAYSTDGDNSRRVGADAQTVFDDAVRAVFPQLPGVSIAPGSLDTRIDYSVDTRLDLKYREFQLRLWNWRQNDIGVGPGLALALDPNGHADGDNYLFDLGYVTDQLAENTTLELRASYMDINVKTRQTLFPSGAILPIGQDGNINLVQFNPVLFRDGYRGNPEFFEEHLRFDAILGYTGIANHSLRFAAGATQQKESGKESKNFGPGVLDCHLAGEPPTRPDQRVCSPFFAVDGTLTDVSGTEDAFIEDQDRDVYYASLQDQWQIANDWNLTVGLRYDDYSDFGSTVNPRAALVWDMKTDLTAKLLYGRAFRAPSFAELFLLNNPVALGNPDLDPETTNTYELAIDYRASFDWRVGFNIFYYDIKDLIDFVPTDGGAQKAQNVGQQQGTGFELETEWKPRDDLSIIANYAYQKSEDKELDKDAARAPEQHAYLRASWLFRDDWSLTGEMHWVADRNREPTDPRPAIDDFVLGNINLERRNLVEHLDVGLRVRNVFDEDVREPSPTEAVPSGSGSLMPDDFPLEGRSLHLSVTLHF